MITLSYLNNPDLKARFLAEIAKHEAADAVVQGTYGESFPNSLGFRGCAVGCSLHSLCTLAGHPEIDITEDISKFRDHSRYVTELGIPIELAYLEDRIFENLPVEAARTWPRRFSEAVPVGRDLSGVLPQLLQWSILDPAFGWVALARTQEQKDAITAFSAAVAEEYGLSGPIEGSRWDTLDTQLLESIPEWAWAGAGAGAGAGARAGARKKDYYIALSAELLRLLQQV